jgi:hypothetical protein
MPMVAMARPMMMKAGMAEMSVANDSGMGAEVAQRIYQTAQVTFSAARPK